MHEIHYFDRVKKIIDKENVYGRVFLELLYGKALSSKIMSKIVLPLVARGAFFSKLYGVLQKTPWSQKKIRPFVRTFGVDDEEFLKPLEAFKNFNDFFTRQLKPDVRPLSEGDRVAILPADGRYLVIPDLSKASGFFIKGQRFDIHKLIGDDALAEEYKDGICVFARLCPLDYHRFHFPFDCVPKEAKVINGHLFSVNPLALRQKLNILWENKRVLTVLESPVFGEVLFIEVGATNVGSIKQTFTPHKSYRKGDEKGYFEFGGSSIVMLFKKNTLEIDEDFLVYSQKHMEVKALMGQSLGRVIEQ